MAFHPALQAGEFLRHLAAQRDLGSEDGLVAFALPPRFLPGIVEGLAALSKSGLRYPIPNHGLDKSPIASLSQSYGR